MTATAPSAVGTAGQPRTAEPVRPSRDARVALRPLAPDAARITGGFWALRQDRNGRDAIRSGYEQLETAGNFRNLRIAAGVEEGEAVGPIFMDSDVYKWLEAVAWEYGRQPADDLLELQRQVTDLVARAQAEDGYIDSVQQVRYHDQGRYHDLPWSHEMYCAGHLFQAAVAQSRATGDTALLDVAIKLADHLVRTFGEDKRHDVDGHPVVEMGLVELYRETGRREYLDLAHYFVDARGHGLIERYGKEPTYFSDRVPVREAETVEGHAVRAVYLASGAVDVAIETGDTELIEASERQFASMMATKAYITGGLGSRWDMEAFGDPYELPTDRGYSETCAAIGGVQWAWRLLLATGKPVYADAIERLLYNAFIAGVSLAGTEYFYVNPLQLRDRAHQDENRSPAHGRRGWFDCACCPPNIMRTFASLDGYVATQSGEGLQLHQYATGDYAGERGAVHVETTSPWDGTVTVTVTESTGEWSLDLRVPDWSDATTVTVGGEAVEGVQAGQPVRVTREFAVGDEVTVTFDMSVHLYEADARIDASRGQVAIERGPLVFAVEQADQDGFRVDDVLVDVDAAIDAEYRADLLDGITVLHLQGQAPAEHAEAAWPYRRIGGGATAVAEPAPALQAVTITAIPYYAWANRGVDAMRVWLPQAR
ncbi:glycoside hydrolase family 127 protein [Curtobacterium sp. MCBD17_034]|uniref:glycoside hydrolase family 127 protein n=1 Tax=unclassified Curtobacterium TaxID=257496 RepID=UPI000DAA3BB1|nr:MULTISPECIES: beta-L-arabinofuranosidase domain-containing protein [unclassified Curtobacterium]PZF55497.1 glycoside hydrolase family 127 protein [Curtobacterium sp. MCBD17_034]PZM34734.1 glycoside hydrolase family 127 protein [Curtobacterium sp. MCBD17_031]